MNNHKELKQNSIFARWISGILSNRKAFTGCCIIVFFTTISILLPSFIQSPTEFLGTPLSPPSSEYFFEQTAKARMYLLRRYVEQGKLYSLVLVQEFLLCV